MSELPADRGDADVEAIARRYDVPADAVATLRAAIRRGGGRQAQFTHPALGGMGQWSRHGGIMIGDMFNHALKAKVEQLCNELAEHVDEHRSSGAENGDYGSDWWPSDLGHPSASGSQNDEGYACFPASRRLAIRDARGLRIYDTGDHRISGVAQQQGGSRDLSFSSQLGTVRLSDLRELGDEGSSRHSKPPEGEHARAAPRDVRPASATRGDGDLLDLIERLHALQRDGILTAEEFAAKKTELLARL